LEIDLVQLYRAVEQLGGLMTVLQDQLWGRVAQLCRIPRTAHDRLTKLDSIYCKYLLPYASLSQGEHCSTSRKEGEEGTEQGRTSQAL
jgi:protein Jumonji